MTIAQRAALAEKERTEAHLRNQEKVRKQAAAWDGIDSLGGGAKVQSSSAVLASATGNQDDGDWEFGLVNGSSNGSVNVGAKIPQNNDDDWGLGDFVSAPTSTKAPSPPQARSQSLWDLDEFTSPHPAPTPPTAPTIREPTAPTPRSNTPRDDFDFGDREDRLLDNDDDSCDEGDDDDILGVLSKPVDSIPKRSSPVSRTSISSIYPSWYFIWNRSLMFTI
jgi:hypothetical protein